MGLDRIMFFAIGIIILLMEIAYIRSIRRGIQPKPSWGLDQSTTGKIVSVRQDISHWSGEEHWSYVPTVQYFVDSVKYCSDKQVSSIRRGIWEYARQNDKVEVWYSSKNPSEFFAIPSQEAYKRAGFETWIIKYIIPFFIAAAAVIMFGCGIFGGEEFFGMLGQT